MKPPPGTSPTDSAFIQECEEHHTGAMNKLEARTKLHLAEPIRKHLQNDRAYPSDTAIEKLTGVGFRTIQRIKDSTGDLSHVSIDKILKVAARLEIPLPIALVPLKRQLLLESLIPELAKRRTLEFHERGIQPTQLLKLSRQVDVILSKHVVLPDEVAQRQDALDDWCQQASSLVEDESTGRRVAEVSADYLYLRPRLTGFTTKLRALAATNTASIPWPAELSAVSRRHDQFILCDALSLLTSLRDAAITATQSVGKSLNQWTWEEMVSEMKVSLPKQFRKVSNDVLMCVLEHFGLDLSDLADPCHNVGSLTLKSDLLRELIIDVLKTEEVSREV